MTLSPREWRTVQAGLLVLGLGLLVGRGVVPLLDRWQRQGARLAAVRQRVAMAEGILAQKDTVEALAAVLERRLAEAPRRLLTGSTPAVAASALEGMLQGAVEGAGAQLQQLAVEAVSAEADAGAGAALPAVQATVAAVGDVEGLARLLAQLGHGPRPVGVARVTVQRNPALRGAPDVLQWTLVVRAPVVLR
jgi:hypothetical protein